MRILHHQPLFPQSRFVRLLLAEKKLPFDLAIEKVWERNESFHNLNPAGEVPVLVEDNGMVVPGGGVIAEYLEDVYPEIPLLGRNIAERVEIRRLIDWFERLFQQEVMINLLGEKIEKRLYGYGLPDGNVMRAGYKNLRFHLDYIGYLAETRTWLGGPVISAADFTAAAHISSLDFLGDIDWRRAPAVRDWYARVKSRPCFRPLLADRMSGVTPPAYYADLDF